MDFDFTEDQKLFRDSIKEFLDKEIAPDVDERDKKGPFTKEEAISYFKKFKKIGISFGLESLMELGEAMDAVSVGILGEELFRTWPSLAAVVGLSSTAALVAFVSDETKKLIPKVEKNEVIGCLAITEPDAGSDNRSIQTTAVLDGDEYVVNGSKTWITNGPIADVCLLIAKDEEGELIALVVDKETSPFDTAELHKIGWKAGPTGDLFFDDCRVPKENNLMNIAGNISDMPEELSGLMEGVDLSKYMNLLGMGIVSLILAPIRTGMAMGATGIAQAALDGSIKYCRERVQFGKPIGKFQLVQETLYNMHALTETSRLLGYRALDLFSKGSIDTRRAASLAKCYACDAAVKVTYDAIEIHGGNGLSEDYPFERYFRDARMLTVPDGMANIQKLIVGRELLGKGFSAYV